MQSGKLVNCVGITVAIVGLWLCPPFAMAEHGVPVGERVLRIAQDFSPTSGEDTGTSLLGDTMTSCQENPDDGANSGVICVFSDLTGVGLGMDPVPVSVVTADRFTVESNGQITGVTWWGFMVERAGENSVNDCTLDIAPAEEDHWFIRYYVDDGTGLPDTENIIAEFQDPPGITRIDTGADPFGLVSEMEMHFEFPEPIDVACGTLYHMEIYSNYTFNDCFFCWQTAPPGDTMSLQADFDPAVDEFPLYNLDPEDGLNDFDIAQCQDFVPAGAESNFPSVTLERFGVPDIDTGCCTFQYIVRNNNCIGTGGTIDEFYVAFAKGDAPPDCQEITDIAPPFGWDMEICEPWSDDGRAIFHFTGGILGEQQTTFGMLKARVNGNNPVFLDANNEVPRNGIRAWVSNDVIAGQACGTGEFGPLLSETGEWSLGNDGECALQPIPSLSAPSRAMLFVALVFGGAMLVLRSRATSRIL